MDEGMPSYFTLVDQVNEPHLQCSLSVRLQKVNDDGPEEMIRNKQPFLGLSLKLNPMGFRVLLLLKMILIVVSK